MKRPAEIVAIACALAACAGPPARGQTPQPGTAPAVRPNIYEVAPEQIAQERPPSFVEVSGSASVSLPADRAEVSFAVETRAETAAEASSANAAAMDRVLTALRESDLPGLDLETFGYALQPQYATDQQRVRTVVAYMAQNNVGATIDDVDAVGRLIDAAIGAGANRVAGIAFSASETEPARARALAEAVSNARTQAEAMATALGYDLGQPLEVRGGANRPGPMPMAFAETAVRAAQVAPTPIEAGEQTVTANVTIRFALGPAR